MKVLLPSILNENIIQFPEKTTWRERYKAFEKEGVDRNPFVKHLHEHGVVHRQYWVNYEAAQKDWAKEHKAEYDESSWYLDIMAAQIKEFQPDVVFNTTLCAIPYHFINRLKKELSKPCFWICYYGVRRVGEFREFKEYDFYLTGFRELQKDLFFEKQKHKFFPHYFDDLTALPFNPHSERDLPFTFIGSLLYKYDDNGFNCRRRLIEILMEEASLQTWSYLSPDLNNTKKGWHQRLQALRYELYHLLHSSSEPFHNLARLPWVRSVKEWEVRPKPEYFFNPRLSKQVKPPQYGRALYTKLSRSQVTLNVHGLVNANRGKAKFAAGNIRLFEATGSGACLLTDDLPGLEEFFEPDVEVVTYRNANEAAEKARFLINNPKDRESIANRGLKKAWSEHTSSQRAKQFVDILKENA